MRRATKFGAACSQLPAGWLPYIGWNEDCLYLNVWTTHLSPGPKLPVLVFSQYVETRHVFDLLGAGEPGGAEGVGYLLKDRVADVGEFVSALERLAAGGTALDPEVVSQLVSANRRAGGLAGLTEREREVLALMAEGRSNSAMAARLVITERAVEKHISSIFAKLGLPPDVA